MGRTGNSAQDHDFVDEVRSCFGTGAELQEMCITPSLLSPEDWDALAIAQWSRKDAEVLRDVIWIGGDPLQLQVYGWMGLVAQKRNRRAT